MSFFVFLMFPSTICPWASLKSFQHDYKLSTAPWSSLSNHLCVCDTHWISSSVSNGTLLLDLNFWGKERKSQICRAWIVFIIACANFPHLFAVLFTDQHSGSSVSISSILFCHTNLPVVSSFTPTKNLLCDLLLFQNHLSLASQTVSSKYSTWAGPLILPVL